MMNAVILATAIGPRNRGIGQYEHYILPPLIKLLASSGCQGRIVLSRDGTLPNLPAEFTCVRIPSPRDISPLRLLAEQIYVPTWSRGADVFLSLDQVLPIVPTGAKSKIVVIHGLHVDRHVRSPQSYPEDYSWRYRVWASWAHRRAVEAADEVIAVSTFIADEVRELFGKSPARIKTIPSGVDHERFRPVRDAPLQQALRARYDLPESFYLYVGPYSTNKNLRIIVEAYAQAGGQGAGIRPVVVVGDNRRAALYSATIDRVKQAGLTHLFKFLGSVAHQELAGLYTMAVALIYPSLYEAFGLPPLEAMACGTPVIASNRTAIPEIVGDAGLLFDPTDGGALLNALSQIQNESVRRGLIEKGLHRARQFTWERTAASMAELVVEQARGGSTGGCRPQGAR